VAVLEVCDSRRNWVHIVIYKLIISNSDILCRQTDTNPAAIGKSSSSSPPPLQPASKLGCLRAGWGGLEGVT